MDREKYQFFKGDGIYRKVKRDKNLPHVPGNFKFYACRNFLARTENKFTSLTRRSKLAIYLTNWLSDAVFTGGRGKEIRATTIYLAC